MAENDDARLTAEVLAALRRDTYLRPLQMQVAVDNGTVTLTGSVDSQINRRAAEDAARRVVGIRDVRNYLTLMGGESSSRSDGDIVREIREQMAQDPTIDDPAHFHVRSEFGPVCGVGTAESEEERESVIAAVRRVPGVESVDDRMELRVPMVPEEQPGSS
jgi:osmotically-inducible protein OsmY